MHVKYFIYNILIHKQSYSTCYNKKKIPFQISMHSLSVEFYDTNQSASSYLHVTALLYVIISGQKLSWPAGTKFIKTNLCTYT